MPASSVKQCRTTYLNRFSAHPLRKIRTSAYPETLDDTAPIHIKNLPGHVTGGIGD
jgi:hypothetical protein